MNTLRWYQAFSAWCRSENRWQVIHCSADLSKLQQVQACVMHWCLKSRLDYKRVPDKWQWNYVFLHTFMGTRYHGVNMISTVISWKPLWKCASANTLVWVHTPCALIASYEWTAGCKLRFSRLPIQWSIVHEGSAALELGTRFHQLL